MAVTFGYEVSFDFGIKLPEKITLEKSPSETRKQFT